ncbi:hypothetical protein Peur_003914 [Populus x canadensis]
MLLLKETKLITVLRKARETRSSKQIVLGSTVLTVERLAAAGPTDNCMKDLLMLDKIASLLLFPHKDKISVVLFYVVSVLMLIIQLVFRFDRVDLVVPGIATTSIRGK